jgi:hypothetical protein
MSRLLPFAGPRQPCGILQIKQAGLRVGADQRVNTIYRLLFRHDAPATEKETPRQFRCAVALDGHKVPATVFVPA